MTPIPITRAEYEKKFGVAPSMATSALDFSPAPTRVTRKEWEELQKQWKPQEEGNKFFNTQAAKDVFNQAGDDVALAQQGQTEAGDSLKSTFKTAGTILLQGGLSIPNAIGAGIFGTKKAQEITGNVIEKMTKFGEAITPDSVKGYVGDIALETIEGYESMDPQEQLNQRNKLAVADVLSYLVGGKALKTGVEVASPKIVKTVESLTSRYTPEARNNKAVQSVADEIDNIENNYAGTRKANTYGKGVRSSQERIAQSNVLKSTNAVDENGLVNTNEAIKAYRSAPITSNGLSLDDVEGVVRKNLENEGKTVNLKELRLELRSAMMDTNGLEGANLAAALKSIDQHIKGLATRKDEFGNVPLYKIHDAKIGETQHINFATPPEVATAKKAVARTYKEVVENKSSLPIKATNAELSIYYTDIERLVQLNGKRVKGGKLGRYSAQIVGTGIGMAGGSVGGGLGALIGGVVGGELASTLKGKAMAATFKKGVKGEMRQSPLLQSAKKTADAGKKVDLSVPDEPVGALAGIPKTKGIVKTEAQIKKNVAMQKKAIKAGNFELVSQLKEIYQELVTKLKDLIREYKTLSPKDKNGGFIKNPLVRDEMSNYKTSNPRGRNLSEEARQALTKSDIDPASAEVLNEYLRTTSGGGITRTEVATAIDVANGKTPLPKTNSASTASDAIAKGTPIQQEAKEAIKAGLTEEQFVDKNIDNYVKNTPEYKKWAGNNKNIIEAYHGTPYSFDNFEIGKKQSGAYELDGISFATNKANAEPFSRQFPDTYYAKLEKLKGRYPNVDEIQNKVTQAERQSKMKSVFNLEKEKKQVSQTLKERWDRKTKMIDDLSSRKPTEVDLKKFKEENSYSYGELETLNDKIKQVQNVKKVNVTKKEKDLLTKYNKELETLDDSVQGNIYKVYIKGKKIQDEIGEEIGFTNQRNSIVAELDGDILRIKDADTGQYIGEEIIVNDPSQVFMVDSPQTTSQLRAEYQTALKANGKRPDATSKR